VLSDRVSRPAAGRPGLDDPVAAPPGAALLTRRIARHASRRRRFLRRTQHAAPGRQQGSEA
jgi:hypothetical protein